MPEANVAAGTQVMITDSRRPNLLILAGPNGSGKTTFGAQLLAHEWGCNCISLNADELANQLGGWNNTECIQQAQLMVREQLEHALHQKKDILYETVFSHPSKLDIIRRALSLGYFVRLFFICTESPRVNIERVADRFACGGHTVPGDKVTNRYHRSLLYGAEAMKLVHRGYLYDNTASAIDTHDSFKPIFRTIDGKFVKLYSPVETWPKAYVYFLNDFVKN